MSKEFCYLCKKKLGILDPSLPIENKRYCRTHWIQVSSNLKNPDKNNVKNIDSTGSVFMASEILSDFDHKKLTEKYVMITDISGDISNWKSDLTSRNKSYEEIVSENFNFNHLLNAVNKLSKSGWRCINLSSEFIPIKNGAIYFYALLENSDK